MDSQLEKLARAEERKIQAKPGYRTSGRVLRRLSKSHVVYELPDAERGAWDGFSVRTIGIAVQKRMARDFSGEADAMRKAAVARLARNLNVNPDKVKAQEQAAFADFAMLLNFVPDLARWSSEERGALRAIIAAKAGRSELRYMRLLQKHDRLRAAILRIGSRL